MTWHYMLQNQKNMENRIISKYLHTLFETNGTDAEWFGYYNYDPLNEDHTKMLCNRSSVECKNANRERDNLLKIGYYELSTGEWHQIGETDSWNWQQGAMAQWLPGKGNENKVIYNCSRDGHLTSRIFDIVTGETKEIDWSIYGLTPDGKKSIALDMERSYWCRAYHYQSVANPKKNGRIVEGDGIFEVDLEKNTHRLIIDIKDVVAKDADDDFDLMKHWLEHIMINPSGSRFCFLHRYAPLDNVRQYRTRLCIADIDGKNLQVMPGWNIFMWSHFGWQGDDRFTIYSYKRPSLYKKFDVKPNCVASNNPKVSAGKFVKRFAMYVKGLIPKSLIRKFLSKSSYYQYYSVGDKGKFMLTGQWIRPYFDVDGHPSFTSDGKYMLTDSYPDTKGYRRYIVFNTATGKGMIIAKMKENAKQGNAACDLHPKLSRDNQNVIFDTTSSGKHTMMLFRINWDQIKNKIS